MSGHAISWTLTPPPALAPPPPPPVVAVATSSATGPTVPAFLGSGILRPFVRDQKNDFANGNGIPLLKACVGQVLGTRSSDDSGQNQGEIPWRPDFGSKLYLLKHRKGAPLDDLARTYTADALRTWEPRVVNVKAQATFKPSLRELDIDLRYDVIAQNVPGNAVVVQGVTQSLTIQVPG